MRYCLVRESTCGYRLLRGEECPEFVPESFVAEEDQKDSLPWNFWRLSLEDVNRTAAYTMAFGPYGETRLPSIAKHDLAVGEYEVLEITFIGEEK